MDKNLTLLFFGLSIIYSRFDYTEKDWVRLKVQNYSLSLSFRLQCATEWSRRWEGHIQPSSCHASGSNNRCYCHSTKPYDRHTEWKNRGQQNLDCIFSDLFHLFYIRFLGYFFLYIFGVSFFG